MTDINSKPSNPKDAIGADKLPLHLWPPAATAMGCIGLCEGATKYGRANWRAAGVRASIYYDACRRHLDAWFEGEEVAPDSGVPHLANALACLAIIVDAQAAGKLVDDRNYRGEGYRELVESLTPHVARLKILHADKAPKHWDRREDAPEFGPAAAMADYHQPLPDGVTWDDAPKWAEWFAIDADGRGHWFRGKPRLNTEECWYGDLALVKQRLPILAPGRWRDSLRRRPGQSELPAQD